MRTWGSVSLGVVRKGFTGEETPPQSLEADGVKLRVNRELLSQFPAVL